MRNKLNLFKNRSILFLLSSALRRKSENHLDRISSTTALKEILQANSHITRHFENLTQSIVKQSIADGTNGIPDADSASSNAEDILNAGYNDATNNVKHYTSATRDSIEKRLKAEEISLEKAAQAEVYRQELEPAKRKELENADRKTCIPGLRRLRRQRESVKGMEAVLNEQMRHLEERKNHIEALYQNMLVRHYHRMPPVRELIDHPVLFWGTISVLVSLEILVNFTAFQNIGAGDNNLASLGLGIFFAICQAWSAEKLGTALRKKHRRNIWIFLGLTVVFCGFITLTRWDMEGENLITRILYLVINAVFAGLTTIIAFFHAKHHDFFSLQLRRQKTSAQIEKKHYQMEQLEVVYQKKCEAIEQNFEAQAVEMAKTNEAQIKERIERYRSDLLHLDTQEHQCLQQLKTLYEGALAQYRHFNQEARHHNHHPQVKRWNSVHHAITAIFLFASVCWGCSSPAPETHVWGFYDQTDTTHTQEIEPMLDYILSFALHDTLATEWGEMTIHLSPIGETSTPETVTLHLPASEPFWLRNEQKHRQHLWKFREDLRHALVALTQPGTGTHRSYINRSFHHALQSLSHHHGTRIVLSWSDLILNESEISFYSYRNHPEKIMEHRDSLIRRMTKNYPLPDLAGVKLINIHHAAQRHDELHEAAKRYFRYYWTSLGMEVEFLTHLPTAHAFTVER